MNPTLPAGSLIAGELLCAISCDIGSGPPSVNCGASYLPSKAPQTSPRWDPFQRLAGGSRTESIESTLLNFSLLIYLVEARPPIGRERRRFNESQENLVNLDHG
jgi:hypothetical protein